MRSLRKQKNAEMAGADIINLRLQANKEMLESQIRQWSKVYDDKLSSSSQAEISKHKI